MIHHNKQRHAAAMLVHQLGSGIEALNDIPPNIALEKLTILHRYFITLGNFLIRMGDIEIAKNDLYRTHN